jgi:hypothetical protein
LIDSVGWITLFVTIFLALVGFAYKRPKQYERLGYVLCALIFSLLMLWMAAEAGFQAGAKRAFSYVAPQGSQDGFEWTLFGFDLGIAPLLSMSSMIGIWAIYYVVAWVNSGTNDKSDNTSA